MLTDSEKHLPFPEAISRDDTPDRFDVKAGNESRTDLTHGVMVIDAGGPCEKCGIDHARATRLHEMGHVAWTPADWQKRSERAKDAPPAWLVNAVEDARLTRLRALNRLEKSPAILCEADGDYDRALHGAVKVGDLLAVAAIVAAAYGSKDMNGVDAAIDKVLTAFYDKNQNAEADALNGVRRLVDYAIRYRIYPHDKPNFRSSLHAAREILAGVESLLAEYKEAKETQKAMKATVVRPGKNPRRSTVPKNTWGRMNIVEPPLTRQSPLGMERRFTARDEGPIPTRFDRWSIDKRIFRTKKRVKGAAVLVDVSGSMSWDEEDLRRVLEEVPAATVALYSGNGTKGDLVIVAHKGRRATWGSVRSFVHGGNVIDGPALEWLAEQPQEVKVWMSDGGTTGPHDSAGGEHTRDMERDVRRILRRGGIMRVWDADDVMKVLTGKQKFVPDRDFHHPW